MIHCKDTGDIVPIQHSKGTRGLGIILLRRLKHKKYEILYCKQIKGLSQLFHQYIRAISMIKDQTVTLYNSEVKVITSNKGIYEELNAMFQNVFSHKTQNFLNLLD